MLRHLFFVLLVVSCLCSSLSTVHAASDAFTPLDVPGAIHTLALGLNDVGQVVGYYEDSSAGTHGFLYNAGLFTPLDAPGASETRVRGINNRGQILGVAIDQAGGLLFNACLPWAKAPNGVLLFGHLSLHHRDQVWPYLRRIDAGEDITAVAAEAYEVVQVDETR